MTSEQFKAWRKRLGLSQIGAAEALGLSASTVANYESGRHRGRRKGECCPVPRYVELACAALSLNIDRYDGGPISLAVAGLNQKDTSR